MAKILRAIRELRGKKLCKKSVKKVLKTGAFLLKTGAFLLKKYAFLRKNTKKYAFFSYLFYLIVTTQPPKPDSQPKIHEICG